MDTLKTTYKYQEFDPIFIGGTSATISSNGEILATPLNEDIIITNLKTNEILHKIEGDGETITNLQITPDGTRLAINSLSQQLRIYDLTTNTLIKSHKLSSPIYMSTVDSMSTIFAFGGSDGIITIWDIENNYITHSLKGHGSTICSLKIYGELNNLNNWRLASGDIMGTVKIWDLVKRKAIHSLTDHNTAVRGLDFNHDGSLFLSGGRDSFLIIYNTKNYKTLYTFPIDEQIEASGFVEIQGREFFYTGGSNNLLKVWDIESGDLIMSSKTPLKTNEEILISDVIKLEKNNMFLVLSDQTLVEMEIENDSVVVVKRIAGNQGIIADMKYCGPNKSYIAMATNSPALRITNLSKPLELKLYEGHTDLLNALDVSNDGYWVATASKDNEAIIWKWNENISDFELYTKFQGHAGSVSAISFNKSTQEPKFLITGSNDLTIKKWKIPTTKTPIIKSSIFTRRAHDKDINSIDVSPNDEYFATASYDKVAKIWNFDSGEILAILKGHKRGLWDINFFKFDQIVVTSSGDKTIKIWSLKTFKCLKTFEGHTNSIQKVQWFNTINNPQIISCGADGLIKIWDYKAGECVRTLDNHDNRIWAMDVKTDEGDQFITADGEGRINLWEDNTIEEIKLKELKEKEKIEQEQTLSNYINSNDYQNAFLLALNLNHSMKLYNIIQKCIEQNTDKDSIIGSFQLENTISMLNNDQLILLFKKMRDWNINFKFFDQCQKLMSVVLKRKEMSELIEIPGLIKVIDSIIPYNERHWGRVEDIVENCYILDYTVEQMNKLIA
ncbi:unnamed protein product [Candida verbasci]|uniref:U3 small nucleolar RNA-associated protein 13 C-terminal domain-containing protein n=1 Tax=Candida verbasci TaxID=1227364 RepID=A0A9W4U0S2_9ASCO|nr:unnamed protein product [Candida verbasci]